MQVRRYSDPVEFYGRVEPFLRTREAEHCLLLGLSKRIAEQGYDKPLYEALVEVDGEVAAVCVRTAPMNVILSEMGDPACAALLADDLHLIWDALPGLLAPPEPAKAFHDRWYELTGAIPELAYRETIYRLDKVIYRPAAAGEMVRATEKDFHLLLEWITAFHIEALGNTTTPDAEVIVRRSLNAHHHEGGMFLWMVEDNPVSLAGYTGRTANGIRIGPVYTPPEQRGNRYGMAISAALSQHLLDGGRRFVFLYADSDYAPSNHVYRKIGYQPVANAYQYNFRAGR